MRDAAGTQQKYERDARHAQKGGRGGDGEVKKSADGRSQSGTGEGEEIVAIGTELFTINRIESNDSAPE